MNPHPLDGNAAAGDLADIFAFDVTTAITTCATCRHTHPIATLRAYMRAPGMVLRCASCDAVQIRLVRAPRASVARPARHRHARDPGPPTSNRVTDGGPGERSEAREPGSGARPSITPGDAGMPSDLVARG